MEKKLDMQCDLSLLLASNLETCTYVYKHIQARKKDIRFYMNPLFNTLSENNNRISGQKYYLILKY